MTDVGPFTRRLDAWLREGPQAAPAGLLAEVLSGVDAGPTARGRMWRTPAGPIEWRQPRPAALGLVAAVALLLLAVVGAALLGGGTPAPSGRPTGAPAALATPTEGWPGPLRTHDPRLTEVPVLPDDIEVPSDAPIFDACRPPLQVGNVSSAQAFDPVEMHGRIAYSETGRLWAVDPARPESRVGIDVRLTASPVAWSPAGDRLLLTDIRSGMGVPKPYILSPDGTARILSEGGDAAFAPDGRSAVYSYPGVGLCLVGVDGSAPQLLAWDFAEPMDGPPAWSPDGGTIAWLDFVEDSEQYGHHAFGLSFIHPDGTRLRQLVTHFDRWEAGGALSYSPDGRLLLLWGTSEPAEEVDGGGVPFPNFGTGGEVWVVRADGSDPRRLTSGHEDRWPTWSPDGTEIAFVRDGRLYLMDASGENAEPLGIIEPDGPIAWNRVQ